MLNRMAAQRHFDLKTAIYNPLQKFLHPLKCSYIFSGFIRVFCATTTQSHCEVEVRRGFRVIETNK